MIRAGYSGERRAVVICADQVGCGVDSCSFSGKGGGSLVTQRDRSNEAGMEMVSSLYDGVTLINRDGNMRGQYNYFEVFKLD